MIDPRQDTITLTWKNVDIVARLSRKSRSSLLKRLNRRTEEEIAKGLVKVPLPIATNRMDAPLQNPTYSSSLTHRGTLS